VVVRLLIGLMVLTAFAGRGNAPATDLGAGPYPIGFRLLEARDGSRTFLPRTDLFDHAIEEEKARPIRIYLWYPAAEGTGGEKLRFGRYAALSDEDFRPRGPHAPRAFSEGPLPRSMSEERLKALLSRPVQAREGAEPAAGRFPQVVIGQGLYYESPVAHALLSEYLASYGFVVATCPLVGPDSRLIPLQVPALETQVRDLEFVVAYLRELPFVDARSLGLLGFDMGGMSALVLAMRNSEVDAFASIDAGILFNHPSGLPRSSPHYDLSRFRIPWLHATRTEGGAAPPGYQGDASLFETAVHADRWLVLVGGMRHTDFTSYALIEDREPLLAYWGPSRGSAASNYRAVCAYLRHFFAGHLNGEAAGRRFLALDPADAVPGVPLTIEHRPATPAPPTAADLVNAIYAEGIEVATARLRELHRRDPNLGLAQETALNGLGYQFLYFWGQSDVAVALFELVVTLYPGSANAYDSLGEALLLRGDQEGAIRHYRRSLELDPTNDNARRVLEQLGP